jgi:hypothetical protein
VLLRGFVQLCLSETCLPGKHPWLMWPWKRYWKPCNKQIPVVSLYSLVLLLEQRKGYNGTMEGCIWVFPITLILFSFVSTSQLNLLYIYQNQVRDLTGTQKQLAWEIMSWMVCNCALINYCEPWPIFLKSISSQFLLSSWTYLLCVHVN